MARSTKKVIPKRRGRPATGKDPLVSTRMPTTLIANVEAWADQMEIKRHVAPFVVVDLEALADKLTRPPLNVVGAKQPLQPRKGHVADRVVAVVFRQMAGHSLVDALNDALDLSRTVQRRCDDDSRRFYFTPRYLPNFHQRRFYFRVENQKRP